NDQISSVVDSLTRIYVETEKSTTFSGNYNSELNEKIKDHFRVDSLKVTKPADLKSVSVEFDQIFTSLDNDKKAMILEDAKRLAQSNQRNILQNEPILYNKIKWINKHIIEWHRKYTMSLACLIFFFIGAPLGAIIRKGGFGTPVVVSILMFIFYYIVSMIGENFAREGVWEPTLTMWFSTFFFLIISIFMTYQAVADTLLVSASVNSKILKRFKFLKSFLYFKEESDQNETSVFDQ
ncbi:MAG TPA: LptF/LptG family permease, partial [Prolixibacteraceae bacterium]|nr:LptF/LptG family permease [Prolixibacteraceae bacterium]